MNEHNCNPNEICGICSARSIVFFIMDMKLLRKGSNSSRFNYLGDFVGEVYFILARGERRREKLAIKKTVDDLVNRTTSDL